MLVISRPTAWACVLGSKQKDKNRAGCMLRAPVRQVLALINLLISYNSHRWANYFLKETADIFNHLGLAYN